MEPSYLAGGTGLAFQLGHRVSVDLDFFFKEGLDFHQLLAQLSGAGMNGLVMSRTPEHCEIIVDGVKVDFMRERTALRFPIATFAVEDAIFRLADSRDIGLQKLLAIASRGSKKDFIDLYCLTRTVIPLQDLLALAVGEQKGLRFSLLLFLKGLIDFEEAESDLAPLLVWDVTWETVKAELSEEVKGLALRWS